jgi:hypothetical protein
MFENVVGAVKQGIAIYNSLTPQQRTKFLALGATIITVEREALAKRKQESNRRYALYRAQAEEILAAESDDLASYFESLTKAQEEEADDEALHAKYSSTFSPLREGLGVSSGPGRVGY